VKKKKVHFPSPKEVSAYDKNKYVKKFYTFQHTYTSKIYESNTNILPLFVSLVSKFRILIQKPYSNSSHIIVLGSLAVRLMSGSQKRCGFDYSYLLCVLSLSIPQNSSDIYQIDIYTNNFKSTVIFHVYPLVIPYQFHDHLISMGSRIL